MMQRVKVAAAYCLFLAAVAGIGWWLLTETPLEPKDLVQSLIALGAATVACLAWNQSRKSANAATKTAALAQLNEERSKHGWTITPLTKAHGYVLRNTGTVTALDVSGSPLSLRWSRIRVYVEISYPDVRVLAFRDCHLRSRLLQPRQPAAVLRAFCSADRSR
jgi:hypothetical protein